LRHFTKNIAIKSSIRPDILYPALTGYPAKTVSGASLVFICVAGVETKPVNQHLLKFLI
jgi:hypothetical protein